MSCFTHLHPSELSFATLKILASQKKIIAQLPEIHLLQYPNASFNVVVDKGGLDALMGEESAESTLVGEKLLSGVSRVVAPGGVYLCVTLAQSQVLSMSFAALFLYSPSPFKVTHGTWRKCPQTLFPTAHQVLWKLAQGLCETSSSC